jgi:hypothetical protein
MAEVGKKTGKQTQAGRDVYETPEGEMVSEKSTTIEYKGKWINIPTIHGGKQYSEDELMEMLDKGLIKPTSSHNKLEEAIQAAQSRSDSLEFNKGGTPMLEKQMELFEDGGLRDEGGMVDEVSGNDVPVGSTRKEVRDDIPAMLSEGEFVFPADVVRYIGLENLMRIRQDAKQGLKQMDAMGQMGNGDEAVIPDDMPFGVMDLIIVDGGEEEEPQEKAQGGVIHANQGTFITPMFNPSDQDVREYKNDKSDILYIPFVGGEPVYPIPTGYFPAGQAPEETETEQAIPVSDDSDPPPPPPQSEFQKAGGFGMDTSATDGKALDMWIKEAERVGTVGNVVAGIASAINPLIGVAIALANKKQKKDIISMLDEKIAQAQKTPIAGQVKALRDLKTRLTTDEGKGILSKVVSGIIDTVSNALGFGEEEKKKAKVNAVVTAGSSTDESDDATKNKIDIADKNAGGDQDPDALANALSTADEAAIAGSTLKEDGTYDISSWYIPAPTVSVPTIPTDPESSVAFDVPEGMDIQPDEPTVAMPEEPTVPSLTEPDTLPIRTSLMQDEARAMVNASRPDVELEVGPAKPATVTTAVDDLRKSIADLSYDESRATAMSSLSGFGEDASSQAIRSYLEKAMNNVDTIVKGTDTPTTTTPTTTAPAPSGGDDDDGPSFAPVATQEQISQAQRQATSSAVASGATQEEAEKAGTIAGGQMAGKGYVGGYGFNKGGLASRKKKKK